NHFLYASPERRAARRSPLVKNRSTCRFGSRDPCDDDVVRRVLGVPLIALTVVLALANPAAAVSIVVSRHTVAIGETVVVSGDTTVAGTHCAAGDSVTLISNAFKGHAEFAGVGAVNTPVDATGHFRVSITITSAVTPGTYTVGGRCGGGNFSVGTTLVVT